MFQEDYENSEDIDRPAAPPPIPFGGGFGGGGLFGGGGGGGGGGGAFAFTGMTGPFGTVR